MKKLVAITLIVALLAVTCCFFSACNEQEYEDTRPVLKVGMECAYKPYNWTQLDASNGAVPIQGRNEEYANGYDVQIAQRIADYLGMKLEVYAYEWGSLIPAVQSGALDLIIAGMSPTAERKQEIDFSEPYYDSNIVVVVKKTGAYANATSIDEIKNMKIAAQEGTFHEEAARQLNNNVTLLKDFSQMIVALNANTIDGYIAEEPGAIADCIGNSNFTYLKLVNNENGFLVEDLSNVTLACGIKKGSALTQKVNEAISAITQEERIALMNDAINQADALDEGFFEAIGSILEEYGIKLLEGVGNTMLIALISTIIGLFIGIVVGIIRTVPKSRRPVIRGIQKVVDFILATYIEIFRGTPMMVQAMVIFWGYAFASGGRTLALIPSALLIVSINTGAYMSEIVRGGIISVDKGQYEGATSIGLNHVQTMSSVVMPQVLRNILPSVSNEFVINIKDTSVLNVIGVAELFYQATLIQKTSFKMFETYLIICVIYFILTFAITRLLRLAEKLLEGKNTYTICGSQSNPDAVIRINSEEEKK